MKRRVSLFTLALSLVAVKGAAFGQTYPSQPIRMIVPFPPGGATDAVARILAQKLGEQLGQPVVVDNRAGAAGIIGVELAAKSAPDGYTLVLGNSGTHAINVSMYRKLPYDPVKDFEPISQAAGVPLLLVVNPDLPIRSVNDLVALAKSKPGQLNYGSAGTGNSTHIAGELFGSLAGLDIKHIPYKASTQASAAVVAGDIQFAFLSIGELIPLVKAGRVRPLAVTSANRAAGYGEMPTLAEAGVQGYEATSWSGLFAPRGTPKAIIARLNAEMRGILSDPDVRAKLIALGTEPTSSSPSDFAAMQQADIAKYAQVFQNAGISKE